jgi:hypothetical protein
MVQRHSLGKIVKGGASVSFGTGLTDLESSAEACQSDDNLVSKPDCIVWSKQFVAPGLELRPKIVNFLQKTSFLARVLGAQKNPW